MRIDRRTPFDPIAQVIATLGDAKLAVNIVTQPGPIRPAAADKPTMHQHADILDQQESLGGPFVQSVLLHAAIAGVLIVSSISFEHSHQMWGSANTSAGTAVAINSVKTIPLPARPGKINPVANNTESLVPQESSPKPEPRKQVEVPEKAIPLPSRISKRQPKPEVSTAFIVRSRSPENQLLSHIGRPAVVLRCSKSRARAAWALGVNALSEISSALMPTWWRSASPKSGEQRFGRAASPPWL